MTDAARLVLDVMRAHGMILSTVAESFGFTRESLRAWLDGAPCSPEDMDQLRAALAARKLTTEAAKTISNLERLHGGREALCARFGFDRESVSRWALGGPCSPTALARLQDALKVRPLSKAFAARLAQS